MIFKIDKKWEGFPLKSYLQTELRLSRNQLILLKKKENGILLEGEKVTVRRILKEGDRLELALEDETENENLVPYPVEISILYEDEDLILVNKPANMPTHPSHGHFDDTLANALAYYFNKQGRPFVFRAVNRLDRNTSGVVLVCKNKRSAAILGEDMKNRLLQKEYLALLSGEVPQIKGVLQKNIKRQKESIILREATTEGGEEARTEFEVLEKKNGITLVKALPKTGRTHQLRVHFSDFGYPILGDDLYFEKSPLIERQALHAYRLTFLHPITRKEMTVIAPVPPDFQKVLKEKEFEKIWF